MGKPVLIVDGKKYCSTCKRNLFINEFTRDKKAKSGLDLHCKKCKSKLRKISRAKPESKITELKDHLKRYYDMTLEQYDELLEIQNGICAVCNKKETARNNVGYVKRLSVDHDHNTGKIRGCCVVSVIFYLAMQTIM